MCRCICVRIRYVKKVIGYSRYLTTSCKLPFLNKNASGQHWLWSQMARMARNLRLWLRTPPLPMHRCVLCQPRRQGDHKEGQMMFGWYSAVGWPILIEAWTYHIILSDYHIMSFELLDGMEVHETWGGNNIQFVLQGTRVNLPVMCHRCAWTAARSSWIPNSTRLLGIRFANLMRLISIEKRREIKVL